MSDFGLKMETKENGIEFQVTYGETVLAKREIEKEGIIHWVFTGVKPL